MTDAIIAPLVEQLVGFVVQQIRDKIGRVTGVEKEVLDLLDELKRIRNVLNDAEWRGFKDKSVKGWLCRLEDACYEMDDVLDEWDYASLKLQMGKSNAIGPKQKVFSFIPPSSCLCFKKVSSHHHVAKKIKEVKAQLDEILKGKDEYNFVLSQPNDHVGGLGRVLSTSFVEVEDICGRSHDKEILLSKFLGDRGISEEELGIRTISIVGLGGIGKTTRAQLVYNDRQVEECYPFRIWICVSDRFDQFGIVKGIIQSVQGSSPDTNQLDLLLIHLKNCIREKKFLLVLDDVWTQDYTKWEPLKNCLHQFGGKGSKILVTTRNEMVAKMMGTLDHDIHFIGILSDDDCWFLLSRIALHGRSATERENFEEIGKKIAKRCKGLPLAAKALGSLLRFKHTVEEWENVSESEIWELDRTEVDIFPHLFLSYNELSPTLKRCFSYCAAFPKGSDIEVESLIRCWLVLGYLGVDESACELELRGRDYFDDLAMCSFFQEFKMDPINKHVVRYCKMHDLVHDFAKFLRKDMSDDGVGANCQVCSRSLVSSVKKYRSLFYHREPIPYICDCLIRLRLLSLKCCGLQSIPKEIEKLIHLRHLNLSDNKEFTGQGLKNICRLYNLRGLILCWCDVLEIPREIGKLTRLRYLDTSYNWRLKEFPEEICDLLELRSLNVSCCVSLCGLPRGTHKLTKLKHLNVSEAFDSAGQFPYQAIGELINLHKLSTFSGNLSYLKKLNQVRGDLILSIEQLRGDETVAEAKEAELSKKVHVKELAIYFFEGRYGNQGVETDDRTWIDVLDALEPHRKLAQLDIWMYGGSKLPDWIASPLNQLRKLQFEDFSNLSWLPPLGRLPCLEELLISLMHELEFVGQEFLGITTATSDVTKHIRFPKLKELKFWGCPKWKEWEDITTEEENSTASSFFPCLEVLTIQECNCLLALPRHPLRKAPPSMQLIVSSNPPGTISQ